MILTSKSDSPLKITLVCIFIRKNSKVNKRVIQKIKIGPQKYENLLKKFPSESSKIDDVATPVSIATSAI